MSRDIVDGWTKQGLTVRDAYEKAATEELSAEIDADASGSAPMGFDNMKKFITHVTSEMAGTMGACGDASIRFRPALIFTSRRLQIKRISDWFS